MQKESKTSQPANSENKDERKDAWEKPELRVIEITETESGANPGTESPFGFFTPSGA